jgi:hypothetical protein
MVLALVREEAVPVEQIRPKDVIVLPRKRRVTVERVDEYDNGFVVRWSRLAEHGEPGHRGGKTIAEKDRDAASGRYLGSLKLLQRGETVTVTRG